MSTPFFNERSSEWDPFTEVFGADWSSLELTYLDEVASQTPSSTSNQVQQQQTLETNEIADCSVEGEDAGPVEPRSERVERKRRNVPVRIDDQAAVEVRYPRYDLK